MSRGESFCLGGPSIWMSDVFIEEWLAPRKSRWILHSAFKSNGMQMSGFRAVPWLLLLSWPQASASWACLYSTLSFLLVVLPHVLRKQFRFKSCTCYLSLRTKRLKQKVLHYFGCSQPLRTRERTEREWKPCSTLFRDNEIVLFNWACSCSAQRPDSPLTDPTTFEKISNLLEQTHQATHCIEYWLWDFNTTPKSLQTEGF